MTSDPGVVADQLLAGFDSTRSRLSYPVIVELRQRVEAHKFQDPLRALQIAEIAVLAATTLADPAAEALAAWAKATALLFNGRAGDAIAYYRQAEARYDELAQPIDQVGVQAPLVYALNAAGDQEAAAQLAAQVQTRCLALGEPARQALAHLEMNIGTICKQQGDFVASLAACDRAKTLFLVLGDTEAAARAELNRANVLQEMDHFAEAAAAYAAARAPLVHSQRNRQQVALIDFNLGLLAERRGHFLAALRYLEAAHEGFTPTVHKAATDLNRAMIYNRLNLPADAYQLAHAAQRVFADNGMDLEEGHALLVAGTAERQLGRFARAVAVLEDAIHRFGEHQATFWQASAQLALAQSYLQMVKGIDGDADLLQQSQALASEVQTLADRAEWPTLAIEARLLATQLALAAAQPPFEQISAWLHESIALAERYHLTLHAMESYALLGRTHQRQDQRTTAWHAYQQAITRLEAIRGTLSIDELQLGYLADKASLYGDAARLHIDPAAPTPNHALLLYLLNLAAVAPLPPATMALDHAKDLQTEALLADLRRLEENRQWQQRKVSEPTGPLAAIKAMLDQLESEIADCWRRLRVRQHHLIPPAIDKVPEIAALSTIDEAAGAFLTALQSRLTEDDALLVYANNDGQALALVIRAQESTMVPLGPAAAVEQTLQAWRFHINDHALIQQQPTLAQPLAIRLLTAFYRLLMAPLMPHLAGCTRLYLALPAPLHDLPVAALWDGGYLLTRFQLTYLSAPAALLHATVADTSRLNNECGRALVIGHSHGGELPSAVVEATQIAAAIAPRFTCALRCEEAATVGAFLTAAPDATLIHLAAHAHFAATGPLFSAIHLADRELTLLELYHGTQLRCHPLVVLSTCVSGQGSVRGAGLLGLARALVAAGAGQLIVTTWRIADASTATLMGDFYRHLPTAHGGTMANGALRAAQLTAAATLHPFYWAGFLFVQG